MRRHTGDNADLQHVWHALSDQLVICLHRCTDSRVLYYKRQLRHKAPEMLLQANPDEYSALSNCDMGSQAKTIFHLSLMGEPFHHRIVICTHFRDFYKSLAYRIQRPPWPGFPRG